MNGPMRKAEEFPTRKWPRSTLFLKRSTGNGTIPFTPQISEVNQIFYFRTDPKTHVVRNVLDTVMASQLDPNAEPAVAQVEALKLDTMKQERLAAIADTTNDSSNNDIKAVTAAATALYNCLFEGRFVTDLLSQPGQCGGHAINFDFQ